MPSENRHVASDSVLNESNRSNENATELFLLSFGLLRKGSDRLKYQRI